MQIEEMNIYQKMSAISSELKTVRKNLEVGYGDSKYKAVAEKDVLNEIKPLEEKYGIYSYPSKRRALVQEVIELKTAKGSKTNIFFRTETEYRFVNANKPDEYIEVTTFGDGLDNSDKAPCKAMTYADKYALLKAYKIATGDDIDKPRKEEPYKPQNNTYAPITQENPYLAKKPPCKSKYAILTDILSTAPGWDLSKVKSWIINTTNKDIRINDLSDSLFTELVGVIKS